MTDVQDIHAHLRAINQSAAFNRWCGLKVKSASAGPVELVLPWRAEFGQYTGFLHAGLIGALIDTACGFAAVTVAGPGVLAAHYSVNCLRPARGEHFIARARVVIFFRPSPVSGRSASAFDQASRSTAMACRRTRRFMTWTGVPAGDGAVGV